MKFLCRLGRHGWYSDCAMFWSVRRCRRCNEVESDFDEKLLEAERHAWRLVDKNLPFTQQMSMVAREVLAAYPAIAVAEVTGTLHDKDE